MNDLQIFENEELGKVRTVIKDKEIWFVAKDLCDILDIAEHRQSTRRLDDDEKGVYSIHTPGGMQETIIVNEPGMYTLVLKSRKPNAKKFKRWLTHDVIPSIREKGFYVAEEVENENVPQNEFDILRGMIDKMEENSKLSKQALQTAQSTEDKLNDIQEILKRNPKDWRRWVNRQFSKMCDSPKEYSQKRNLSYRMLEGRIGCNLKTRLNNKKERASKNGATDTKISKINNLDVISESRKLKTAYIAIVKELRTSAA